MSAQWSTKWQNWAPYLLVPILALVGILAVGSVPTWFTLTVAGLAMGLIIFVTASGLTLIFGLMDILNFGHGLFIALGAFVATSVFAFRSDWSSSSSCGIGA